MGPEVLAAATAAASAATPAIAAAAPAATALAAPMTAAVAPAMSAAPALATPGLGASLAANPVAMSAGELMAMPEVMSGAGSLNLSQVGAAAPEAGMLGAPGVQGAAAPSAMSQPMYPPAGTELGAVDTGAGSAMTQAPAPVEEVARPGGIGAQMSSYADQLGAKMLDALPAAGVSMAGTGLQQMALAKADDERRAIEEEEQRKLSAKQAEMAGHVSKWGQENLSPAAIAGNREASETELSARLRGMVDGDIGVEAIGNMPSDFYTNLADRTAAVSNKSRDYANLTAKMLSHGNNKKDISSLLLNRELGGIAGDYSAIAGGAQRNLSNVSPGALAMIAGSGLQGMAPALSKI